MLSAYKYRKLEDADIEQEIDSQDLNLVEVQVSENEVNTEELQEYEIEDDQDDEIVFESEARIRDKVTKFRVLKSVVSVLVAALIVFGVLLLISRYQDQFFSSFKKEEFWKHSIIYQIYPRSFYDANGDGIGDLKGIATKADYFVDLGVGAIWLSPIFKSPMADFGYDVSDYTDIDPIFGNLDDFDYLLEEMHKRNIKVVLDLVPNHSSNQHKWFLQSVKNDSKYRDYYVWGDPLGYKENGDPIPPNNWLSFFRHSAWEWCSERQQFYLHQFLKEQPDLNYRNPAVVEEMKNVLRFWLDRGVDGFRVDAIMLLFEVKDFRGADEPAATPSGQNDPTKYRYLNHTLTANLPETIDLLSQFKQVVSEYRDKLFMLETGAPKDINVVMRYYGNDTAPASDFPFNFYVLNYMKNRSSVKGTTMKFIVELWLNNMPKGRWPDWVLGNHDSKRAASKYGVDLVDAMNMFSLLLPGTPISYNGEELGMQNTFISWEENQDPYGCNYGRDNYMAITRDPERTPMQWDDTPFAGFTNGNSSWLPVNENYHTLNVIAQNNASQSHIKVYKQLARLRKENTFKNGNFDVHIATENIFAFVRSLTGEPSYIIVINTSTDEINADLTNGAVQVPSNGTVVVRSSTDIREHTEIGLSLSLKHISLVGGEGIVLRVDR